MQPYEQAVNSEGFVSSVSPSIGAIFICCLWVEMSGYGDILMRCVVIGEWIFGFSGKDSLRLLLSYSTYVLGLDGEKTLHYHLNGFTWFCLDGHSL